MNIYVYICVLVMVITALSYLWWIERKERNEEEKKQQVKDALERQYRDHYIE